VVTDATRLERNLNLALQVMEVTDRVVVCLNLMDEAQRHGLEINHKRLARDLGVPVVPTAARQKEGVPELLQAIADVATGKFVCAPHRIQNEPPELKAAISQMAEQIQRVYPELPNARWVALRLLDGDDRVIAAVRSGELGDLRRRDQREEGGTQLQPVVAS
jgi:ferrous iron transport protein B